MMTKISDEFWTPAGPRDGDLWWINKTVREDEFTKRIVEVADCLNEADARLVCDLHNAALVQELRKWNVVRKHNEDRWYITPTIGSRLYMCDTEFRSGSTPAAAVLAANNWIESQIEHAMTKAELVHPDAKKKNSN